MHSLDYESRYILRFLEYYMKTGYLIRPRQPHREIHLQLVLCTKWRFVEDISSWNWLHPPFTLLSTCASPFPWNSRPSRRSIRKVKLLSEINYLLIRGWRLFLCPFHFTVHQFFRILASVSKCQLWLSGFYGKCCRLAFTADTLTVLKYFREKSFLHAIRKRNRQSLYYKISEITQM